MIRSYEEKDKEKIYEFHKRILRETSENAFFASGSWDEDFKNIEEVYINPGGCFVLIEENGSIKAMGALKIVSEKVAEIKRMRVETSLQRQGLGQKIFDYLLLHAKNSGIERIILDTSEVQEAAQKFYIKNGFTEYKRETWRNMTIIFYEMFF